MTSWIDPYDLLLLSFSLFAIGYGSETIRDSLPMKDYLERGASVESCRGSVR